MAVGQQVEGGRKRSTTRRPAAKGSIGAAPAADGNGQVDATVLEPLLGALQALYDGDYSVRLPAAKGVVGELHGALNALAARQRTMDKELARVSRVIAKGRSWPFCKYWFDVVVSMHRQWISPLIRSATRRPAAGDVWMP